MIADRTIRIMRRMWMNKLVSRTLAVALCAVAPAIARAEIKTKEITYKHGEAELQGFYAWDDAIKGKRPAVLIVHEWWGHNQHVREQAKRIAAAGYVGFALDMYGKGKLATHPGDAKTFATEATADPKAERARFEAALAQVKKIPEVSPTKIGAVGYCFGGGVALDMARMAVPLAFVATFHGALATKQPAKPGFKPRVLVLQGADDPMVGKDQVEAFKQEMTAAKARFEVVEYPGAKHAFTNPDADKAGVPGLAYNAEADRASFDAFLKFLREQFGAQKAAPQPATPTSTAVPKSPAAPAPAAAPKPGAAPAKTQ